MIMCSYTATTVDLDVHINTSDVEVFISFINFEENFPNESDFGELHSIQEWWKRVYMLGSLKKCI